MRRFAVPGRKVNIQHCIDGRPGLPCRERGFFKQEGLTVKFQQAQGFLAKNRGIDIDIDESVYLGDRVLVLSRSPGTLVAEIRSRRTVGVP
jgi:hypothetical protein